MRVILVPHILAGGLGIVAGVLTFYLVLTAVLTVCRSAPWLDLGAMLVGLTGALSGIALGFDAIARGGIRQGIPAPVFFTFAAIGLLAIAGDVRMIRSGGLRAGPRLARHLWRMCLGLVIAASFFLGPPGRVPELIRIPALLPVPVVVPLMAMFYWLWRVRIRRNYRGMVGARPQEAG